MFTFNGATKIISVDTGVTGFSAEEIYSAWKEWAVLSPNIGWAQAMYSIGGEDIGGGQKISGYFFLINGWVVRPQEASHTLTLTGNLINSTGQSPFIPTIGNYNVMVSSIVTANAISVESSGGGGGSGGTNGVGQYVLTVTAKDADDVLVNNVRIGILGTSIYTHTNTLGVGTLNLDNGSYTLYITPPYGFQSQANTNFTIGGSNLALPITLTDNILSPANNLSMCNVYINVLDQYGRTVDGATVWADVSQNILYKSDSIVMDVAEKYTTVNGSVNMELIRSVKYKLFIEYESKVKSFMYEVPDLSSDISTREIVI